MNIYPEIVLTLVRDRQRELERSLRVRYEQVERTVKAGREKKEERS